MAIDDLNVIYGHLLEIYALLEAEYFTPEQKVKQIEHKMSLLKEQIEN